MMHNGAYLNPENLDELDFGELPEIPCEMADDIHPFDRMQIFNKKTGYP